LPTPRQMIGAAEQAEGAVNLGGFAERDADPAALRQNVMRLCQPCPYQFIADGLGKRNVDQVVTVNVPKLALSETIFRAAEAMAAGGHSRPTEGGRVNRLTGFHDRTSVPFEFRANPRLPIEKGLRRLSAALFGGVIL